MKMLQFFSRKVALTLALALALSAGGVIQGHAARIIKLAHPNVPAHPMGQGYELFKKDLEERSKGAFKVQIYDSSKYGNFDAVVQGIRMGVLQMGSDGVGNFSVFNPKLMLFDMPFMIPSYEASDLITDGPIGQELAKSLESNNIKGLGYIEIGFKNIFSNRPVRTLEDAKDLKIRSTHSKAHIAVLQALGMNPTPVAWGEVYTALQQKTVDGIDIDLNLAYFNKFPELTKYVTMSRTVYSPHLVMISTKFWDKLTPQEQQWVTESFKVMQEFERAEIRKNEAMIIEKIKASGGEVIELTPEERQRWVEATKGVFAKFNDAIPAATVEAVRNTVNAGK
ncbi:TRAP transporter substrate-binding protein [Desulfovibrio cuneatus]|uniref:TRAP transporter substrate-binding protein n=1 Tax=Desulfovibrio cuneatus TaxID=159728 RepID=UPI00040BDC62|nr:TRAP transporter substrate-binding protein [Desulfovibrio cuneatus]